MNRAVDPATERLLREIEEAKKLLDDPAVRAEILKFFESAEWRRLKRGGK